MMKQNFVTEQPQGKKLIEGKEEKIQPKLKSIGKIYITLNIILVNRHV